nr:MAG TPA: hypothetical protein [Caudoviricetes sp.]
MLVWWLEEGLRGFITFRIRKIKNIIYIKGYLKMPQTLHYPPYISNKKSALPCANRIERCTTQRPYKTVESL